MFNIAENRNTVSFGAVHTLGILIKIIKVANDATLCCIQKRMAARLYKNIVL